MKKKIAALLALLLLLTGCGHALLPGSERNGNNDDTPFAPGVLTLEAEDEWITVYLVQGEYMVPVTVRREKAAASLPEEALDALLEWHYTEWAVSPLPLTTEIKKISLDGNTAVVDFGLQTFSGFSGGTLGETLILSSVVMTLTEIDGIDSVQILVDGQKSPAAFGHADTSEPLYAPPVNLETGDYARDGKYLKLWFMDRHGMFLVPVSRKSAAISWEAALQELINGPSSESGLVATMPANAGLLEASLEQGVCTVDLSLDFVQNFIGGTAMERHFIDSLVLTLTEFEEISEVRLTVEGKGSEALFGHVVTDANLTRPQPNMFF